MLLLCFMLPCGLAVRAVALNAVSSARCCCAVGDVSLVSVAVVNITYIAVGAYDAVVVSGSAVFNAAVG